MKILISLSLAFLTLFANEIHNIQTYKADFKQIITNQSNKDIVYNGKIFIKSPFSILWIYDEPIVKYVYINDNKVAIIEPDLEQAIITKLSQEINIFKLLTESKKISDELYKNTVNNIEYSMIIKNNQLKQITYKDEIDNNVNINFSNIKQNINIDNNKFKYEIPYDYDIIRK